MRTYYVYIMASRSRVLYTGVTNDLVRRVDEHKRGLTPGFTSRYRVSRLVYFEAFGMFATPSPARSSSKAACVHARCA